MIDEYGALVKLLLAKEVVVKNMLQCQFLHCESKTAYSGTEPGWPLLEANVM